MQFGSLFTGIGGMDLGLERAGMSCMWQVEVEPYCTRVLERHWPKVKRYGDIRQIKWQEVEHVDLICGGFPCQPFSLAGRRKGVADERNLWPEMLRAVRGIRPHWVLGENVPGIGPYLDTICADLEGEGYEVILLEIPAAAFGAPHLRYRLFIIAHWSEQSGTLANRNPTGPHNTIQAGRDAVRRGGADVAHAESVGRKRAGETRGRRSGFADGCSTHADSKPPRRTSESWGECGQWDAEPDVGRVADGIPSRVDRLRALGNAVVPAIAEWLGHRILEVPV